MTGPWRTPSSDFRPTLFADARKGKPAGAAMSVVPWGYVPAGSPSRGGDVTVYVFDRNQPSLPAPFYSFLVSISVFMALSTVFHSINSLDNSPFSHTVLPVLSLPYWSYQLYVSL